MAFSIAEMILLGLFADWLFRKLRMPGLLGMLLLGILFGPYVTGWMDPSFIAASADLRMMALIIILLRAGFELSREALNKVGLQALLLSFVPGIMEGTAIALLGPIFLPALTHLESAMLGFIIAAVSPAVVVPMMLDFIERRMGAGKGIPTMIMAAASLDDVIAIVIFSSLLGLYTGSADSLLLKAAGIPVSILSGIAAGLLIGWLLLKLFDRFNPRATKRTMIVIGISIVLIHFQQLLEGLFPFAALLAVMATGFIILEKREHIAHEISSKLGKIWVFASIMLFTLVGAQVDITLAWNTGLSGLGLIACGLLARSGGVLISLTGSRLNYGERLFTVVSFWPKATVQAAIGAVPLLAMQAGGMNTAPGQVILAVAVMSIVFTAPLGAIAIKLVGERVLVPASDTVHDALDALVESR